MSVSGNVIFVFLNFVHLLSIVICVNLLSIINSFCFPFTSFLSLISISLCLSIHVYCKLLICLQMLVDLVSKISDNFVNISQFLYPLRSINSNSVEMLLPAGFTPAISKSPLSNFQIINHTKFFRHVKYK